MDAWDCVTVYTVHELQKCMTQVSSKAAVAAQSANLQVHTVALIALPLALASQVLHKHM